MGMLKMDSVLDYRGGLPVSPEQKQVFASATVISMVVILLTWVFSRSTKQRPRLPPGPRGLPVLGSLLKMGTNPNQSLFELSKKYGPLMFMRLGRVPAIVVSNAAMAKEVLKTHDHIMASRPDLITSTFLSYGRQDIAFAVYGPHWRQLRKLCSLQLFTAARINHFQDVRQREVLAMLQSILTESEQGNVMNARIFLGNLTMNLVTLMLWKKKYRGLNRGSLADDREATEFTEMIQDIMFLLPANNIADFIPVLKPFVMNFQGLQKRMEAVRNRENVFLTTIVEEHREAQSRISTEETVDDADNFVDLLLKLSKEPEYAEILSPDTILGVLADLLGAGTDTASISLEWTLSELLRRPDVIEKAQDELMSVVGVDRLVTEEDLPSLKYLEAVIKESLRLHPPTPLSLPHFSTEACTIAGFHVPANSLVFPNIYAIQRDPATWNRPLDFLPERFLDSDIDFRGKHFELIPFSAGRRICPAVNLASIVVHLALAQLLHCFNWTLEGDQKPEDLDMNEANGLTCARANPLSVLAKPRLANHVISPPC